MARELKKREVVLLYDNLRESGNDPDLVEYIKHHDPKLLENVSAGRVPEIKTFKTTCRCPSNQHCGPG